MKSFDPCFIRTEAIKRACLHSNHPSQRILGNEHDLVGLAGEVAFADYMGLSLDLRRLPSGDGGKDFLLSLLVQDAVQSFRADVKTARIPAHLLVEVGKCEPLTIYVLAQYSDATQTARCLGWEWGLVLLRSKPKTMPGYSVVNYHVRRASLRAMDELRERQVSDDQEVDHG